MPKQDICAITCYFNPSNYISRPTNYNIFKRKLLETNVPLYTIECTFNGQEPLFESNDKTFHIRSQSILWQKERLLNLLTERLPDQYTKVVWLDADVIFLNKNWLNETSELLDNFVILQPYERAERLSPNQLRSTAGNLMAESYGKVFTRDPQAHLTLWKYGHTGYAWAARRDFFSSCGLYETAIVGGGDLIFAHSITGDFNHKSIIEKHKITGVYLKHLQDWMHKAYDIIQGSLSFTPGRLLHLWHGKIENRLFKERHVELSFLDFNPYTDIRISEEGCLEWCSNKPELHKFLKDYFSLRKEDG
jgi:hypothetical protein